MIRYYHDAKRNLYLRVRMDEITLYYSPVVLGKPKLHKARVFDAKGADCGDTYVLSSCFHGMGLHRLKLAACPRNVRKGISRFIAQYVWPRRVAA